MNAKSALTSSPPSDKPPVHAPGSPPQACFADFRSRNAWECNQPIAQWKARLPCDMRGEQPVLSLTSTVWNRGLRQARVLAPAALESAKAHRRWLQWLQEGLYGVRPRCNLPLPLVLGGRFATNCLPTPTPAETLRVWLKLFPPSTLLVVRAHPGGVVRARALRVLSCLDVVRASGVCRLRCNTRSFSRIREGSWDASSIIWG